MPAIVEADDEFLYVAKFRGAGQGTKALVVDFIGTELARAAGFRVQELVFATLDECPPIPALPLLLLPDS